MFKTIFGKIRSTVGASFLTKRKCLILLVVASIAAVAILFVTSSTVNVIDGETVKKVRTYNTDADAILKEAGIEAALYDIAEFNENGDVVINRCFPVTVIIGDNEQVFYTSGGTVADLIRENGINFDGDIDIINCDLSDDLYDGMVIEIDDVSYVYFKETVVLPSSTETVYSAALNKGVTKTTAGKDGEKVITYKKKLVNGVVSETSTVSEEITKNAVNSVKYIGTASPSLGTASSAGGSFKYADPSRWVSLLRPSSSIKLDANGAPVSYKKLLTGIASAYSPNDGRNSATGVILKAGYVAVNPKVIPYGSKLYITTADGSVIYGYAVAADTGGFVYKYPDRIVDLFFETEAEASRFGLKNIKIYILE